MKSRRAASTTIPTMKAGSWCTGRPAEVVVTFGVKTPTVETAIVAENPA
jgi:hypothetical protein